MRIVFFLTMLVVNGQTLSTVAGTGVAGSTDGKMDQPFGLGLGPDDGLYFYACARTVPSR
jgi:hypothetical protein